MRFARDESGYGEVDSAMELFNAAHHMPLNPEATGDFEGIIVLG
jgi:hypothetical protein